MFSILEPFQLFFHDVYLLSAFFGLIGLATVACSRWLAAIGRESLLIFLVHSFLWQIFLRTGILHWFRGLGFEPWIQVGCSLLLTLALSFLFALAVHRSIIMDSLIAPRAWENWLPVKALGL